MIITWWHAVRFVNLKMRYWLIGKYFDHIFNDNLRDWATRLWSWLIVKNGFKANKYSIKLLTSCLVNNTCLLTLMHIECLPPLSLGSYPISVPLNSNVFFFMAAVVKHI